MWVHLKMLRDTLGQDVSTLLDMVPTEIDYLVLALLIGERWRGEELLTDGIRDNLGSRPGSESANLRFQRGHYEHTKIDSSHGPANNGANHRSESAEFPVDLHMWLH